MSIGYLQLSSEGVYVVWKWDICTYRRERYFKNQRTTKGRILKVTHKQNDHEEAVATPVTHIVVFKCIGATKSPESLTVLKIVIELAATESLYHS